MLLKKRIYLYLIVLLLSICPSFGKNNIPNIIKIRVSYLDLNIDSIYKRITPIENTPTEAVYLKKMLPLARKKNNDKVESKLLYLISKNYFNRSQYDSLKFWVNKTTSFALRTKEYNEYFDALSLLCSWDIYNSNLERALDNACHLISFAKKIDSDYGRISSYENLGTIYMETLRDKEAVRYFNEGCNLLKKEKNLNYSYLVQFLTYISECNLKLKDYKSVSSNMDEMQKYLDLWKKKEKYIPYDRCMWLMSCYKLEMYVALKDIKQAKIYKDKALYYSGIVNDEYVLNRSNLNIASYYDLIKDYDRSCMYLDRIRYNSSSFYVIKMKAEIMLRAGKYKESSELYSKAINSLDSTYNQDYARQLNTLRNTHEIDKLELINKELIIKSKTTNLKIISVIAFLLLLLTLISVVVILQMKRMKNKLSTSEALLKEEKNQLEISQKDLLIAKENAEASNKFKDTFLANMSHEVRTPLNAIVGFSGVISDMYANNQETKEFSHLIKLNSDLLLKLINDTIDISLLQTNQMEFKQEQCELNSICISVINKIKENKKENVEIIFSPSIDKPIYFTTDIIRLQQLLSNLLLNSLKFTDKGYIKLEYKIDQVSKRILFIVEDTGKGISPEMQTKIFESFQKVNPFTQGIGLGLSLCRIISIHLKGKLMLDTTYTNGTKMIFIHPLI